jgi:hypothetical protein
MDTALLIATLIMVAFGAGLMLLIMSSNETKGT